MAIEAQLNTHTHTHYTNCGKSYWNTSLPLMINSHTIHDTWKLNTVDGLLKGHRSDWTQREAESCPQKNTFYHQTSEPYDEIVFSGGSFLSLFAVQCGRTRINGNKTVLEWINGLSTRI